MQACAKLSTRSQILVSYVAKQSSGPFLVDSLNRVSRSCEELQRALLGGTQVLVYRNGVHAAVQSALLSWDEQSRALNFAFDDRVAELLQLLEALESELQQGGWVAAPLGGAEFDEQQRKLRGIGELAETFARIEEETQIETEDLAAHRVLDARIAACSDAVGSFGAEIERAAAEIAEMEQLEKEDLQFLGQLEGEVAENFGVLEQFESLESQITQQKHALPLKIQDVDEELDLVSQCRDAEVAKLALLGDEADRLQHSIQQQNLKGVVEEFRGRLQECCQSSLALHQASLDEARQEAKLHAQQIKAADEVQQIIQSEQLSQMNYLSALNEFASVSKDIRKHAPLIQALEEVQLLTKSKETL